VKRLCKVWERVFELVPKVLGMGVKGLWKQFEKGWKWLGDGLATSLKGA
jgi:hypothetical protein